MSVTRTAKKMKTNFRCYQKGAKMKQGKAIECLSYTGKIRK